MNDTNKQNKKWWQFRQMGAKDYGRTAIICLLLVGLKGSFSAGLFLDILIDILAIFGTISGILWIKEQIKSRGKKS